MTSSALSEPSPPGIADVISHRAEFCLLNGDAEDVLSMLPPDCIDSCLTSPPYWAQRRYDNHSGLGTESDPEEYIARLTRIFRQLRRVIRRTGSLWLNLGDTYRKKQLQGIPWRVAIALQNEGWVLRNAVIWDKVKGNPCNARDKLRNVYEFVFHFVLSDRYYYDLDSIRKPPGRPTVQMGRIVTPTGVSGVNYQRQILRSQVLTPEEKRRALQALRDALERVRTGEIPDFRMIIRGQQRSTHSDSREFSGRAAELETKGFCILPYHRNGTKPGDVWQVIPEDEWRRDTHYAVFPISLCRIPILATCPPGGILCDPFVGTGTSLVAALLMGRRGVGIDTSPAYLAEAQRRLTATEMEISTNASAPAQLQLFDSVVE